MSNTFSILEEGEMSNTSVLEANNISISILNKQTFSDAEQSTRVLTNNVMNSNNVSTLAAMEAIFSAPQKDILLECEKVFEKNNGRFPSLPFSKDRLSILKKYYAGADIQNEDLEILQGAALSGEICFGFTVKGGDGIVPQAKLTQDGKLFLRIEKRRTNFFARFWFALKSFF